MSVLAVVPVGLSLAALLWDVLPPAVDWPMHLAQGVLLQRWDDPGFVAPGTYCARQVAPYHGFHHLARLVGLIAGPEVTGRCLLVLSFGLHLLGCGVWLRRRRGHPALWGPCAALFFGFVYFFGFGPNLLAMPLVPLSLWACDRLVAAAPDGTWAPRQGGALTALLLLAWVVHPVPFALAGGCCGVWAVARLGGRGRSLARVAVWLAVPAAVAVAYLVTLRAAEQDDPGRFLGPTAGVGQRLSALPDVALGGAADTTLERPLALALLLTCAALVLCVGLARRHRRPDRQTAASLGVSLVPALLYLSLPVVLLGATMVYQRMLQPALLLPLLLLGKAPKSRLTTGLLALAWALSVGFLATNLQLHRRWSDEIAGLRTLAPAVPRATRLLALVPRLKSRLTRRHALRHAPIWLQLCRGGEVRYSFTHFARMPVTDCDPGAQAATLPLNAAPWRFDPARHGAFARHLLIHLSPDPATNRQVYPWLARSAPPYRLLKEAGRWVVFEQKIK